MRSIETRDIADGEWDDKEVKGYVESTQDYGGTSAAERREAAAALARNRDIMETGGIAGLEAIAQTPAPEQLTATDFFELKLGGRADRLEDDAMILNGTGTMESSSGVTPYTRGYDSMKEGVLRHQHGTVAPETTVLSDKELEALRGQSPGKSLDRAAALFGIRDAGFERMASSKDFYDPQAAYWWGKCHAWSWAALDNEVNKRVDVEGPAGQRGVWLAGEWLSRADLGNWMMGVADKISLNSGAALNDTRVTAEDLLVGMRQYLTNGGGGVVADIWNDKKKGNREVWNQPFVGAEMTSSKVSTAAEKSILEIAKQEGVRAGSSVRLVSAVGKYGVEATNDHEEAPSISEQKWNIYVVADANGKMVKAYEADHPSLKPIANKLPVADTADLPDYFWKPQLGAIADAFKGRSNPVINTDINGERFKFFVEKTLGLGVPGATRAQFEEAVKKLSDGAIPAETAKQLVTDYAGVANAYSPAQWTQFFGNRGLDAKTFGAAWTP
ncbi:MAG: hypothetical protein ACT4TC_05615, partial [Myxococcaceae bacterium]